MTTPQKIWVWFLRLFPLFIPLLLLIPGSHWMAQEIRTFAALITVLILPGYGLARVLRLFDSFNNWFEAFSLSVALSWGSGLSLWLLFFFLGVPLNVVSLVWLGLTVIGLIASMFVPLSKPLRSAPKHPSRVLVVTIWLFAVSGVAYLYGGQIDGDAWSYMTWLRNITVGDIAPTANIHASWEVNYPFFKNLYSPTLFYYALSSWLGQVDSNWIWTRTPAFWAPVMLAIQFSLTYLIFKRRLVAVVSILLAPLLFAHAPIRTSSLGDSISLSTYVLVPLSFWLLLQAAFNKERPKWQILLTILVSTSLTFEHFPHIVYFLLNAGMLALFNLFRADRRPAFWRLTSIIVVTILLSLPFIYFSWQLAQANNFNPAISVIKDTRGSYWGGENLFIVNPQTLLGNQTFYLISILAIVFVWIYRRRLANHQRSELLIASPLVVMLVGFNPLLTPAMSRLLAYQTIIRLGQALVILPSLSYGLTRIGLRAQMVWTRQKRLPVPQLVLLLITFLVVGYHLALTAVDAAQEKVKVILYGPGDASPILSEQLVRRVFEAELEDPPYPILVPSARLTRYLDTKTLDFIHKNIESDSVFLSERLTELQLPNYVDQITYLGRLGWPEFGDICPKVRSEGADQAFSQITRPEVRQRLDVACAILNPEATGSELEQVIEANRTEIDYILVTPNTAYLDEKLGQIMPQARIYGEDGFAIYAVRGQE